MLQAEGLWSATLWLVLLSLSLILLYIKGTSKFSIWTRQGVHGPTPVPFIGNILDFIFYGGFYHGDIKLRKIYGKYIGSYLGETPNLLCADPKFLQEAMIKQFGKMPNRLGLNRGGLTDLFLVYLTDDHWRHVRAVLTPTFTSGKLKQMVPLIQDCCERLVEHVGNSDGKPFDTKAFAAAYSLDVVASTAFGIQVDSQKNPYDPILHHAATFTGVWDNSGIKEKLLLLWISIAYAVLPSKAIGWFERLGLALTDTDSYNYFVDLSMKLLTEKNNNSTHKDFIQLCKDAWVRDIEPADPTTHVNKHGTLWTSKGLTTDEIIANAVLFFFAGYEPSSTTLNFILYELALNQEIQAKVYEEIKKCEKPVASHQDISNMVYLDCVVSETLRMYPPVFRTERVIKETVEVDGIVLPPGSILSAMIYAIHHDPEIWPDPERFDPDRFSPENKGRIHQCAFIPFGVGNRSCIGMRLALLEIKMALVSILQHFRIETCESTLAKPLKLKAHFQLATERPIKVRGIRR